MRTQRDLIRHIEFTIQPNNRNAELQDVDGFFARAQFAAQPASGSHGRPPRLSHGWSERGTHERQLRADETCSERGRISGETCFNVSKCDATFRGRGRLSCFNVSECVIGKPGWSRRSRRFSKDRVFVCLIVSFSGLWLAVRSSIELFLVRISRGGGSIYRGKAWKNVSATCRTRDAFTGLGGTWIMCAL
jgi:hypothetical protein